ncbi:hypothetical protein FQN57_005474 [Myotisia sp. PD_48]|nr:hypothetical protein FQN57_005474 [Myotisia sp. PD_48]
MHVPSSHHESTFILQSVNIFRNMFHSRKAAANSPIVKSPDHPPQVTLPDVETGLNMHRDHNGLFDPTSPSSPDGTNGILKHDNISTLNHTKNITIKNNHNNNNNDNTNTRSSPPVTNGESTTTEWSSAIGHAMTGKSGRVIHNLQEDIARLTRECNLHRCRAEEAQRTTELLKQQLQNMTDRLRNSEQSHETNLISIARKDRKITDLKSEIESHRQRRIQAEDDARKTNQLAAQERDEHQRKFATAQEIAQRSKSAYDALAQARLRDRTEFQSRVNTCRKELDELNRREAGRQNQLERLEVVIEQKDRELSASRERGEHILALFERYKEEGDKVVSELVEKGRKNNEVIDEVLRETGEVTDKMKWVMKIKDLQESSLIP